MSTDLRTAIDVYFRGERTEMIAFLVFAGILVVVAIALWMTHDRFARSLSVVLALCALIACSTAVPLMFRDGPMQRSCVSGSRKGMMLACARMRVRGWRR